MDFFQDDKVFRFRFNLIVARGDAEETYALNQTCSPSLPWSPREVTCEANYMEVRVTGCAGVAVGMGSLVFFPGACQE